MLLIISCLIVAVVSGASMFNGFIFYGFLGLLMSSIFSIGYVNNLSGKTHS